MLAETIAVERKATSLDPLDTVAATIKARVAKGDKATSDADGHYLAAGLLLVEAKRRLPLEQPGLKWPAFLVGQCKLGTTRTDELIAIAEERTTLAAQREKNRNRQRTFAAKNKVARANVSNGQSARKNFFDRMDNITIGADAEDLAAIEHFATTRMSQRRRSVLTEARAKASWFADDKGSLTQTAA